MKFDLISKHSDDLILRNATMNDIPEINKKTKTNSWKAIASYAFKNAFKGPSSYHFLSLPEGITDISSSAFYEASYLYNISLPSTLTFLGSGAFRESGLVSINLPDNLEIIRDETFCNCLQLSEIKFPKNLHSIQEQAFLSCRRMEHLEFPETLELIGPNAFAYCTGLKSVHIPANVKIIDEYAFSDTFLNTIYFAEDGDMFLGIIYKNNPVVSHPEKFTQSRELNPETHFNFNFRKNLLTCMTLKKNKQISFIPQDYVLKTLPTDFMQNFFINNNHLRWRTIVQTLTQNFKQDPSNERNVEAYDYAFEDSFFENTLTDLLKIYYAIGGFSADQSEREKAFKYTMNYLVENSQNDSYFQHMSRLHERFSRLILRGEYQPTFAQFFMKYYHKNNDFMFFLTNQRETDYLCQAHNNWVQIITTYKNRVVNGNTENELLSPEFVAKHSKTPRYYNIEYGNEQLAELASRYGYSQSQFEEMQAIFDFAKTIKDKCIIRADKSKEIDCIQFRILEKDDPLGFVLGDITNCCQALNRAAHSCVVDGYKNPNAGFLVFEETSSNKESNSIDEPIILGQAYVWYDPTTQTVCYDNIELPSNILKRLTSAESSHASVSLSALLDAIEKSATSIMETMNKNEIPVKYVTTGSGYNELNKYLKTRFPIQTKKLAKNPKTGVYSDATSSQFIIKSFGE